MNDRTDWLGAACCRRRPGVRRRDARPGCDGRRHPTDHRPDWHRRRAGAFRREQEHLLRMELAHDLAGPLRRACRGVGVERHARGGSGVMRVNGILHDPAQRYVLWALERSPLARRNCVGGGAWLRYQDDSMACSMPAACVTALRDKVADGHDITQAGRDAVGQAVSTVARASDGRANGAGAGVEGARPCGTTPSAAMTRRTVLRGGRSVAGSYVERLPPTALSAARRRQSPRHGSA